MKRFPLGKVALASLIPLLAWLYLASAQDSPDRTTKGEKGAST
jgi:hypothetical protein